MIKIPKSKRHQRNELDSQIEDYLDQGGEVNEVARGVSGRIDMTQALPHVFEKKETPETRTSVNEVIDTLDERRKPKSHENTKNQQKRTPKKVIIYDDFGQPLRWENRE